MKEKEIMKKLKVYLVKYASGLLRVNGGKQEQFIYSDEVLNKGDFVVIEHIDCGVFIGQVLQDVSNTDYEDYTDKEIMEDIEYKYIQHIDLSDYIAGIEREKRKKELKKQMERKFAEIDKEKKFEYYATLDEDFKTMYDEYKEL